MSTSQDVTSVINLKTRAQAQCFRWRWGSLTRFALHRGTACPFWRSAVKPRCHPLRRNDLAKETPVSLALSSRFNSRIIQSKT